MLSSTLHRLTYDFSQVNEFALLWRQMHIPMEFKPYGDEESQEEAAMQLFKYMKQVLADQLDRRFVFGLTLCGRWLNVFLCDRSGLLSMDKPIDIHLVSFWSCQRDTELTRPGTLPIHPYHRQYFHSESVQVGMGSIPNGL